MSRKTSTIAKRTAQAGFMFFLVKGLLWLIIPAALYLVR